MHTKTTDPSRVGGKTSQLENWTVSMGEQKPINNLIISQLMECRLKAITTLKWVLTLNNNSSSTNPAVTHLI